jgi:hypothetical protein
MVLWQEPNGTWAGRAERIYMLKGSKRIALLILDLGARKVGWSTPRPGRFTPRKDPVPIVQETGWAQARSGHVYKSPPLPLSIPGLSSP